MKITFKNPTIFSLIAANLFTIALAVLFKWDLLTLLWVYLFQNIIIGFFNFIRILTLKDFSTKGFRVNGRPVEATTSIKVFTAFFFAFHYGFFHIGYAVFLGFFQAFRGLFSLESLTGASGLAQAAPVDFSYVLLLSGVFFANHLFSFLFYKSKPKKTQNIGKIMFSPYARIIPMHLTIIAGGFFMVLGGQTLFLLVFFLLLKTAVDVLMHSIEHREQRPK